MVEVVKINETKEISIESIIGLTVTIHHTRRILSDFIHRVHISSEEILRIMSLAYNFNLSYIDE